MNNVPPLSEYLKNFKEERHEYPLDTGETFVVTSMHHGDFWFNPLDGIPPRDFTKVIGVPGTLDSLPEGGIGIYMDDNFWAVAFLPYDYNYMEIKELVEVLWPHLMETAVFCEDYIEESNSPS
jgi:hypothetical protein